MSKSIAPKALSSVSTKVGSALDGARVLLVEDDADQAVIVSKLLRGTGADLQHCSDGGKACEILRKNTFDLVILDVMLPGKDGWEVFSDLRSRENGRKTPVLFLTCLIDRRDEERASDQLHHCISLSKPVRNNDFFEAINKLLPG